MNIKILLVALASLSTLALVSCSSEPSKEDDTTTSSGAAKNYGPADQTKVQYTTEQLRMKNAEQVAEIVRKKIKAAQEVQAKQQDDDDRPQTAEPEALEHLRDGMRIILARSDQDGTRANVFGRLRSELNDLGSFTQVLGELTQESLAALQDSSTPIRNQVTYLMILTNMMAELRPEVGTHADFQKLFQEIAEANVEVSDEVKNHMQMHSMMTPVSPSKVAKKTLAAQTSQTKK